MRSAQILVATFALSVVTLISCTASNQAGAAAEKALTTIPTSPGGIIEYGAAAGAGTLPAAMGSVLRQIHQACGEKPVVGQVFRVKGSISAGVFFTVVDHAQGNRQLAGMVIATQTGPNQTEAAVVSDSADRFGQTANGMLQQLFAVWNPGGAVAASSSADRSSTVPASGSPAANSGAVPSLHTVAASDNSSTIGLPDGWKLDPRSGGGTMVVSGPRGEKIGINMSKLAVDPSNPSQRFMQGMPAQRGVVVYPFRGDMVRSFPDMFQAWRRANGMPPARLQVDEIKPAQSATNDHWVFASGHVDLDGSGMQAFRAVMRATDPTAASSGMYLVTLNLSTVPDAIADSEWSTLEAINRSWRINQQVMNQQTAAGIAQVSANTQGLIRESQNQVDRIHQIGAEATQRYNDADQMRRMQQNSFDYHEDSISKNGQGFSNYLLDQTVVQNNNVAGTGMVGHATQWNSVANAMVQANPNKYEIVNTPNYWQGVDY